MAAVGAGGVGEEPRVNAVHVESVVALGKHSDPVPFLELPEAYGALCGRDGLAGGTIHRHRDAAELTPLQSRPGKARRRLLLRLVAEAPPAPQSTPRDGVQPERAYQRAQQSRQDDDHVGVEVGVADERVARVVAVRRRHAQLRLQKPPLRHG